MAMKFEQLMAQASKNTKANAVLKSSSGREHSARGPDPAAVAKLLQKKKLEKERKEAEERRKREQLLAMRSQNTKSAKAAKMMACKTKDNDFSKIVLSERELEEKNLIERQLRREMLNDPLERMKARLEKEKELEEASRTGTLKRRRKIGSLVAEDEHRSSGGCTIEKPRNNYEEIRKQKDEMLKRKSSSSNLPPAAAKNSKSSNKGHRSALPPPIDYNSLLKLADKKVKEAPKKTLQEEMEEELKLKQRQREEKEREERRLREEYYTEKMAKRQKRQSRPVQPSEPVDHRMSNGHRSSLDRHQQQAHNSHQANVRSARSESLTSSSKKPSSSSTSLNPDVLAMFRNCTDPKALSSKISNLTPEQFRILQSSLVQSDDKPSASAPLLSSSSAASSSKHLDKRKYEPISNPEKKRKMSSSKDYPSTSYDLHQSTPAMANTVASSKHQSSNHKSVDDRVASKEAPKKPASRMLIDIDNMTPEELEVLKQKIEARNKAKAETSIKSCKPATSTDKLKDRCLKEERSRSARPSPPSARNHLLPIGRYLPPIGATYRRSNYEAYENEDSEEYEDEEDDDMDDFIDDGEFEEEEDYKREINELNKRIFGYDKSKYRFFDDNDIQESSYAEQMKEEARSARIGRQEDLEDMRREEEELRRRKKRRNLIEDSDDD